MTYTAHGIIIGKREYREADRLFTLYTQEHGKVLTLAQGTRKFLSKLAGNLELLHSARFILAKAKNFDRITAIDSIASHEYIKQDLEKCALVLFCFDFFDYCVKEGERDEELFFILTTLIERMKVITPQQAVMITKFFLLKVILHLGHGISVPKELQKKIQTIQYTSLNDIDDTYVSENFDRLIHCILNEHARPQQKSRIFFDLLEKKHERTAQGAPLSW